MRLSKLTSTLAIATLAYVGTATLAAGPRSVPAKSGAPKSIGPKSTDWELLGNSPEMQHHSDLAQIDRNLVAKLDLAWWSELPATNGLVGNPLIKNGIVFTGGPFGQVFANNIRTGKLLWEFQPDPDVEGTSLGNYIAFNMNRGVALSGKNVIIAYHCDLVAIDQATGKQAWRSTSCDAAQMNGITAAPRVGDGMVFTGQGCMDAGTDRGFVDAFDAETGKRKWRFYTAPGDPSKPQDSPLYEAAAKTWGTDWYSKTKGCASVWDAMVYDTKLHQLVFGTGDASPWTPTDRAADAGDELFTNAVVAVDGRTGQYKWHFSVNPHDGWGFEAAVGLMIADLPIGGETRRVVLSVPKNGFAYTLDAATGKFLTGNSYTRINWASGLDANGHPIANDAAKYWLREGSTIVLPSGMGAHGWEAMAYNPKTSTLFIPVMSMPMNYVRDPKKEAVGGGLTADYYYGSKGDRNYVSHGELVAFDPATSTVKWRTNHPMPINSGLLHTSGGLVFQGMADGRIAAFDDATGKEVWSRQTGGAIRGAPSTVMVDGQQYLIVTTGNGAAAATGYVSRYTATEKSRTPPRLLAFRIGGKRSYPAAARYVPVPRPTTPRQSASLAKIGGSLFEAQGCYVCHGLDAKAPGGRAPDLTRMPPADLAMLKIVLGGAMAASGMPKFDGLSEDDHKALFAYIINQGWAAHEHDLKAARKQAKKK